MSDFEKARDEFYFSETFLAKAEESAGQAQIVLDAARRNHANRKEALARAVAAHLKEHGLIIDAEPIGWSIQRGSDATND